MATSALRTARYNKVNDLDLEHSTGANVVVRVVSVTQISDKRHNDGSFTRTADVKVGDETGVITLRGRTNQTSDQLALLRVGSVVVLRNVSLKIFDCHVRVIIGPFGKISAHPDGIASTPMAPRSVDEANDKSAEEYELVKEGEK